MKTARTLCLLLSTPLPSFLRLFVWRLLGHEVGSGCRVSPLALVVAERIVLGDGATIEAFTMIYRPEVFSLGERARIASFVRIFGFGEVLLEAQTFIGLGTLIDCTERFELGRRSQIGPRSMIYTHGATPLTVSLGYPRRFGAVVIGEDCWLAMGCVVYPRVEIGDRVMVLPGLVVSANVGDDKALVPTHAERKEIATRILTMNVDRTARLGALCDLVEALHAEHPRHRLEKGEQQWCLELGRGRRIVLLLSEAEPLGEASVESTCVFCLEPRPQSGRIPHFVFAELTIHGEKTALATGIADRIARNYGYNLVFAESP